MRHSLQEVVAGQCYLVEYQPIPVPSEKTGNKWESGRLQEEALWELEMGVYNPYIQSVVVVYVFRL